MKMFQAKLIALECRKRVQSEYCAQIPERQPTLSWMRANP